MIAANDINPDNIPQSLKDLNQWHPWKIIGENQKLPVQCNGSPAKSNDPTTWTDFQSALDASQFFKGLAFQITDPHVGIDLDECLEADGTLRDWALPIIARFDGKALIEYSPSGTGIKITTIGRKPEWATCLDKTVGPGKQQLECYDNRRFWAITGKPYNRNIELSNAQAEVDWVCETYLKPKVQEAPVGHLSRQNLAGNGSTLEKRAQAYIDSVPFSGGGRNNAVFKLAGHLRSIVDSGKRLSDEQVLAFVQSWNARLSEPLPESEIQSAVSSSGRNGTARIDKDSQEIGDPNDSYGLNTGSQHRPVDTLEKENEKVTQYEPFPIDLLPPAMRNLVKEGSESIGCDPAFIALPALTVCASAIGYCRILAIKNGWEVPSILWTILIGDSGSQKTPAFKLATAPLNKRQEQSSVEYAEKRAEYISENATFKRDFKRWEKKEDGNQPTRPIEPTHDRCLVQDATIEALASVLAENARGLCLTRDELAGWLAGFDRYSSNGGSSEVQKWLEIYGAQPITIDRKTGDVKFLFIPKPLVSICGGIQPDILVQCMTEAFKASGLQARLMMAHPPRRPKRWRDEEVSQETIDEYERMVLNLFSLKTVLTPMLEETALKLKLSADAKKAFIKFVNQHGEEQDSLFGGLAAHWSKLEEVPARLSIILHCVKQVTTGVSKPEVIEGSTMLDAIALTEWFKTETIRVNKMMTQSHELYEVQHLCDWIKGRGGSITARDLNKNRRDIASSQEAELKLMDLVERNLGDWRSHHTTRSFVLSL